MANDTNSEKIEELALLTSGIHGIKQEQFSRLVLQYCASKYTLLPELALVLPFEDLLKFLYAFSGQVLAIPKKKVIESGIHDVVIFFSVKNDPSTRNLESLAKDHDVTSIHIRRIVERVALVLELPNPLKE